MDYIMTTEGLTKMYGSKTAAKDINIHIREGEIYGLIGRNGAGKTTVMRMLSGLSVPTSGSFTLFGKTGKDVRKEMCKVGVLIEHPGIYPNMSAIENLKIKCIAVGVKNSKAAAGDLLNVVGLSGVGDKAAGSFSLGMRQRLGIALALVGNPKIIILDEPINGLDPQGIVEIRRTLARLRDERKITVMISSHILDELAKIATNYGFIDKGHIVRQMSSEELKNECRKSVRMKVSDVGLLTKVMEEKGIEYKVIDGNTADVYAELNFSAVAKDFDKVGCSILTMEEHDESLEAFYLSLLGGEDVQKSVC